MQLILAVAGKDIRAELRSRTALLSALVFAALVLVVFNFARDPTALSATALAPSVLWVTFALAALLAMNRAFTIERENSALDGLLLAPVSREALFLGKLLANLAFVGAVELVTLPLFTLFFNVSLWSSLPGILGTTVLATIGFVSVGTIFSAMPSCYCRFCCCPSWCRRSSGPCRSPRGCWPADPGARCWVGFGFSDSMTSCS